jgi:hypothetical protein
MNNTMNASDYVVTHIEFGFSTKYNRGRKVFVTFISKNGPKRQAFWNCERGGAWELQGTMELAKLWEKNVTAFLDMLDKGQYPRTERGHLKVAAKELQEAVMRKQGRLRQAFP